jgi:hypothetical protein
MGFYLPEMSPDIQELKTRANELPEPETGGHIIDAALRFFAPQVRRAIGRWAAGSYEDQPAGTGWADYLSDLEPSDVYNMPLWALKSTMPYDAEGNLHYGINDPVVGKWAAESLPYAGIGMGSVLANPGTKALQYGRELFKDPFTGLPTGGTINALKGNQVVGELGFTGSPSGGLGVQNIMSYLKGSNAGTGMLDNFLDLAAEHQMQPRVATPITEGSSGWWRGIADKVKEQYPDFAENIGSRLSRWSE